MTEDGRSSGVPVAGGFGGQSDALLDAAAISLWSESITQVSKMRPGAPAPAITHYRDICEPRSENPDLGHPRAQIFSTDFLGCGRAGHTLRVRS